MFAIAVSVISVLYPCILQALPTWPRLARGAALAPARPRRRLSTLAVPRWCRPAVALAALRFHRQRLLAWRQLAVRRL